MEVTPRASCVPRQKQVGGNHTTKPVRQNFPLRLRFQLVAHQPEQQIRPFQQRRRIPLVALRRSEDREDKSVNPKYLAGSGFLR